MAHLGSRVAAFVDGQLPGDEHQAALAHIEACLQCQAAVGQQQLVKHRMTGLNAAPEPPASLLSSLADPDRMCGSARSKRSKLSAMLQIPAVRALLALTGASVTVTAIAYVVGPPAPDEDDVVSPPVEQFVSQFATTSSPLRPVRVARSTGDVGVRRISATTDPVARGGDSPEAVRLLGGVPQRQDEQDDSTLDLLTENFDLSVGRKATVDGRPAVEVVAGHDGDHAASYWIDENSGTLLRRVAYDHRGLPLVRSAPDREDVRTASAVTGAVGDSAPASSTLSATTMTELTRSGWPCHGELAGDLQRVDAHWTDGDAEQVVSLTYTDGVSTLSVFEQSGALDDEELGGFEPMKVADSRVWVRGGSPTVATWDDDGVVYTVVTDAGRHRLAQAIADLPRAPQSSGVLARVGGGVQRLSGLLNPVGHA